MTNENKMTRYLLLSLLMLLWGTRGVMADDFTLPCTNYAPKGTKFTNSVADFSKDKTIWIKMALDSCTSGEENILSMGKDITAWSDDCQTLHFFYTPSSKTLVLDFVDKSLKGTSKQNWRGVSFTLTSLLVDIKLYQGSLYVNGEKVGDMKQGSNTSDLTECLESSGFFSMGTLQIGSNRKDENKVSHAVYSVTTDGTEPRITPLSLPFTDVTPPAKTPYAARYTGFNANSKLTAEIDLSTCATDGKDDDVFCIGTDFKADSWGNKSATGNLHFYYNRNDKRLQISYANSANGSGAGYNNNNNNAIIFNTDVKKLAIELTKEGGIVLKTDGEETGTVYNGLVSKMEKTFWTLTTVQVGSADKGTNASHVSARIEEVESTVKPSKDFPTTLPWTNLTADGKSTFYATVGAIDYDKQSLVVHLDINSCASGMQLLSIGSDIEGNTGSNIYLYLDSKGGLRAEIWKDGKITASTTTDNVGSVKSDLDIRLCKAGLFVDKKRVVAISDVLLANNLLADKYSSDVMVGSMTTTPTQCSSATYKSVAVEDEAWTEEVLGSLADFTNYQPAGKKLFYTTQRVNLAEQAIEADIDLSTCGEGTVDQNIFSVGTNIKVWGASGHSNLHIYYKPNTKSNNVIVDVTSGGSGNLNTANMKVTVSSTNLRVKLAKEGLYLNDQLQGNDAFNSKLLASGGLLSQTSLQIGCLQGRPSKAVYKSVALTGEKSDSLAVNYSPDGATFEWEVDSFGPKKIIKATLDLTNCTGTNENILSIGNLIDKWNESSKAHNLHIYYTKNIKKLVVDWKDASKKYSGDSDGKCEVTKTLTDDEAKNLQIEVSFSGGLKINGESLDESNGYIKQQLQEVLFAEDTIYIGSKQGENRSHATYKSVTVEDVEEEPGQFTDHLPWTNVTADGSTTFMATEPIDFDKQYVEAEIDLSTCKDGDNMENILSVGTNIATYGGSDDINLHIYYNKTSKKLSFQMVDKAVAPTEQCVKSKDITLSSTVVKLRISSEGILIDGKANSDIDPVIPYLMHLAMQQKVQVGSCEGKSRSTAKYNYVKIADKADDELVENITLNKTDYTPGAKSKMFKANISSVDFSTHKVKMVVDLTNSTGKGENIISIGNAINGWGGKGIYNLHVYYTQTSASPKTGNLQINWLDNGIAESGSDESLKDRHEWNISGFEGTTLELVLSDQGLNITGQTQNEWFTGERLKPLFASVNAPLPLMLGSIQGTSRSKATYPTLAIVIDDTPRFKTEWLSNPRKVADRKEAAHATFIPYPSTAAMQADTAFYAKPWLQPNEDKALVRCLNGLWKFCYVKGTETGPGESDFYGKDYDDSDWATIKVPLSWEMVGYGRPVYTNIGYPFVDEPPYARTSCSETQETDHNATGFYRRTFTVPADWGDKRVFVHFDGVYSAAVVWVNGHYVGYSQGSNTDAEFDITDALDADADAEQQLSVRVYRWCDGSYLEGQDMWHLSGIHRDVYLKAVPKVFAIDHQITVSGLADDATSATSMDVKLTVDNRSMVTENLDKTFSVRLRDAGGKLVDEATADYDGTTDHLTVTLSHLKTLTPWTAEHPYLYTVEVSQAAGGVEEMAFATKYGFRQVKIDGNVFKINGRRVFLKGVNAQDIHPEYGKAIDVATLCKDITMMKRANVNTFRCSHYPRQPKMYALFDAYGLYVMPSADVECHKRQSLASDTAWLPAMKDRTERMVRRDVNHPSIIVWSLGNESGNGTNFIQTYALCKEIDPSRPVHYAEHAGRSDFNSYMYPTIATVKRWVNNGNAKPYFMCEYAHAMGQAVGNLKDFWDIVESSDNIVGGCIWDWVDQALYQVEEGKGITAKTQNGFHKWTAGYDYNKINQSLGFQGNFLNNGLVTPDRKWTGKLAEVKKVYQDVAFSLADDGTTLTLKNKSGFTNLDAYSLVWHLLADGRIVEEGLMDAPSVEAGQTGTVSIDYQTQNDGHSEYVLDCGLLLKEATPWAAAGYEVAREQFVLNPTQVTDGKSSDVGETVGNLPVLPAYAADGGALTVGSDGRSVSGTDARGKAFSVTFDASGKMASWTYDGHALIQAGPDFNSRRNIDNDLKNAVKQGTDTSTTTIQASLTKAASSSDATMTVAGSADRCTYTIAYTFYPDATVDMTVTFTPTGDLRRIGLGMQLASGFENVDYYGRGPWSNYVDRKTGSYLGRYYTTVDDMTEEQIHPQTYGDHQDLRELTMRNATNGLSLQVRTAGRVAFSLSHYDESTWCKPTTLWNNKTHWYDLTRQGQVYVHFDYWQRGLGNNSCNGDDCLPAYACPASGSYTYTLRLAPSVENVGQTDE